MGEKGQSPGTENGRMPAGSFRNVLVKQEETVLEFAGKEPDYFDTGGPLVGIIVPVYNGEKTLEQCVESIRSQTYRNLQLILVNDGSTDHSGEICQKHAFADTRITIITKANGGLVRARKDGIRQCTAEFVSWVDADDWIEGDYIENLVKMQQESGADIVAPAHYKDIGVDSIFVKNGIADGVYGRSELIPRMLYTGEFFEYGIQPHLCTKLFRTGILKSTQEDVPDTVIVGEDAAVTYPSILRAERVCVTSIAGYHYIQHAQSMTKTVYSNEEKRIKTLTGFLRNAFGKAGGSEEGERQLRAYENYVLAIKQIGIFDRGSDSEILKPFGGFGLTDRIAVYGAGVLGQRIYRYLVSRNVPPVCWLDRNFQVYRDSGLDVDSPDILPEVKDSFDYIIIANVTEKIARNIYHFMLEKGIPRHKIKWFSGEFRNIE